MCAKSFQSCPTLCNLTDCTLPGSSIHGILQARILESFPSPGDLPDPGIKPMSLTSQADSLLPEPPRKPLLPPQKGNSTLFQVCQKTHTHTDEVCWIELTSSFFFNFPSHSSRVGKISMLTSVTKTFFSLSISQSQCSLPCAVVGIVMWTHTSNVISKWRGVRECRKEERGTAVWLTIVTIHL